MGEDGLAVSMANIISDSFSVTLGALIAVWPLVAYYFGIISFAGPLATFFALPALPGTIITGALAGGFGFIALPIAQAIGWVAWLFLSYLLLVVNGFAALQLSSIEVGSVSTILIWVIPPLLVVAVLVSLTAATMPDDNLHVSFLDVGQGDAILISRGNQQVLVDGGPSPQAISLALSQKMPFWDRTIDLAA